MHDGAKTIDIWLKKVDHHTSHANVVVAGTVLSDDEAIYAERLRGPGVASNFRFRRSFLRAVLSHYTGIASRQLLFAKGQHGKLSLANPLCGPLYFNNSHSKDMLAIGISASPIGIDIEHIDQNVEFDSLVKTILAPEEARFWPHYYGPKKADSFFKCWTCKEAYLKALGTGLSIAPENFAVNIDPAMPADIIRHPEHTGGRHFALHTLDIVPTYAIAVAHCGNARDFDIRYMV